MEVILCLGPLVLLLVKRDSWRLVFQCFGLYGLAVLPWLAELVVLSLVGGLGEAGVARLERVVVVVVLLGGVKVLLLLVDG